MEIVWLEDFLVLSKTLNFSRAAEIRNLTQPAFSRRIQKLEQWLGAVLIDRSTYPATLTRDGRRFQEMAKDVLRTFSEERTFYQRSNQDSNKPFLSFSMVHTIALSFYPAWISQVESQVGTLLTRVTSSSTQECVEALISGNVDFFLSYVHPAWPLLLDEEQYPSLILGRERLVPVSATDSGGKPLYCLDDPARAPIPYLECAPNTITSKMVEVILQSRTQRPHLLACYRNTMSAALKAMAVQRRGLTWLPECAVVDEIHSGQLALAGTEAWMLTMDLRIYRNRKTGTDDKEKIWHYCLQGREMPVEP